MKSIWKCETLVLCALLVICLTASGCVYYNTFYNARKRYLEAEQKRLEADAGPGRRSSAQLYRQLYMNAIRKAAIVLDRYPNSKWVDDSLIIIGKAFYWREEYDEALLKFREIQENFPKSPLIEEARYWKGRSLWAAERTDEARELFTEIGNAPDAPFAGRARIALAELEAEAGNYEAAVDAYQRLLSQSGQKKLRAEIWIGIGNARFHLQRYDGALDAYRNALKSRPDTQAEYQTRLQIGAALELQEKLQEALETYGGILKAKRLRAYEPEVHLRRANVYRQMGRLEEAQEVYQDVADRFPRTDYSADAYYRMGVMEQKYRRDLVRAKELFDLARRERGNSEAARLARERKDNLNALERYQKAAEKGGQKGLEALVNMADLYLFNLAEPDSALAIYQRVLSVADTTEYAPKALYAIGMIYADSLKDEASSRETFRRLIEAHPVSPYAIAARERIHHSRTDDALAEARFLEAEALRREGADARDYLSLLEQLADEYPRSLYAPKALYSVAWTYENLFDDLVAAQTHYQALVDRYPMTDFAEVAERKIKGGFLKLPEKPAEADSTRAETASQDSAAAAVPSREKKPAAPRAAGADSTRAEAASQGNAAAAAPSREKKPAAPRAAGADSTRTEAAPQDSAVAPVPARKGKPEIAAPPAAADSARTDTTASSRSAEPPAVPPAEPEEALP